MRKRADAPPKDQRNYRIDKLLAEAFDDYCDSHDLIRDRTVERALRLFLDAISKKATKTFVVELSEDAAATLQAYKTLFLADRDQLVESALNQLVTRQLDAHPEKKAEFAQLKHAMADRAPN
jgi:hypothetical protein